MLVKNPAYLCCWVSIKSLHSSYGSNHKRESVDNGFIKVIDSIGRGSHFLLAHLWLCPLNCTMTVPNKE